MAVTAPFGYRKDENDHNHLVIDEVTAPVVELIYSIAEEGVGLHTICNRLRKEKVMKPSFYKKELFERFVDEEKCMTGILLMSARYYTIQFMQETLSWQKDRPRPCAPRKDSISRLQSVKSSMAHMSQSLNRTVGTMFRRFCRADRPLSGKVQADMTTSSEGLSNVPIVGVPCLPKWNRKESGIMYWTRPSTAVPNTASTEKRGVRNTTLRRVRCMKLCLRTFRNTHSRH